MKFKENQLVDSAQEDELTFIRCGFDFVRLNSGKMSINRRHYNRIILIDCDITNENLQFLTQHIPAFELHIGTDSDYIYDLVSIVETPDRKCTLYLSKEMRFREDLEWLETYYRAVCNRDKYVVIRNI